MVWPALIAAGASALAARAANRRAKKAAQKQMDFQQYNSNTAVERRMADLQRSGINPILAGQLSASTPSGAMPQVFSGEGAVNSAISAAATSQNIKLAKQQVKGASIQNGINQVTLDYLQKHPDAVGSKYGVGGQINSAIDQITDAPKNAVTKVKEELASQGITAKAIESIFNTAQFKLDAMMAKPTPHPPPTFYRWPDGSARMSKPPKKKDE